MFFVKKYVLAAACAAVATFGAHSASAATFNFKDIADGGGFTDTNNVARSGGEADWNTLVGAGVGVLDVSGISVVGTGSTSAGDDVLAYFDDGAGLGVCSTIDSANQCDPSNDDNVGAIGGSSNSGDGTFETLILTFSESVDLTDITFRAEGHGLFDGTVKINGTDTSITGGAWTGSLLAKAFEFQYLPVSCGGGTGCGSSNEFYIDAVTVAPVPLPASILLLGTGLAGFGFMRRRRRKVA